MGRSQTLFHSRVWTTTHPTMRVIFLIGILLAVAVTAENAEFEEVEASTAVKAPEMELPQMKAQAKNVRGCTRRCAKNRCSVTVFQLQLPWLPHQPAPWLVWDACSHAQR